MLSSGQNVIEANLSLMANGEYQQAHTNAIALIHKDVNDPIPYMLLAKLCFDHNNYQKSLELFEKSIDLDGDNVYTLTHYAQALTHLGDHVKARTIVEHAVAQNPGNAHLADTIGVVYSRTGFHEKAVAWFQQAVSLDPKPANYHYNLAASLQFLGDFEAAESSYKATLARAPNTYRALASLVSLKKQSEDENMISRLSEAYEQHKSDADATLHIGHALAKTYEDMGDYQTSFAWLKKAKAAKCSAPSSFSHKEIFKAARNSVKLNKHLLSSPANTQAPIFIVGLPRTGTTLVDRILSSHKEVVAAGELNTFAGLIKRAGKTASNFVLDADSMKAAQTLDLQAIGEQYINETSALHRNAARFTDKMPLNFFYAALILKALPNARIVALRRGAMDSCLSNYRQLLTVQHAYYDYTYSLDSIAQFYRLFDDLMAHWRANLPKDRFMEIQYEDIVFDQQNQTRRLLDFCGLCWDESCMRFHENDAPVSTASSVQVRQPLYFGSIGRWKRYGSLLDELAAALGDLAEVC